MSRKTISKIALLMILVFGATVLLYPTLFGPEVKAPAPAESPEPLPGVD